MFQDRIIIVSVSYYLHHQLNRYQTFLVVVLRGSSSNQDFKGFLIQGRVRASDSPAGTFGSGTNYQSQCTGNVSVCLCRLDNIIVHVI